MTLYWVEASIVNLSQDAVQSVLDRVATTARAAGARLLEARITKDLVRLSAIVEARDELAVKGSFLDGTLSIDLLKPLRLTEV